MPHQHYSQRLRMNGFRIIGVPYKILVFQNSQMKKEEFRMNDTSLLENYVCDSKKDSIAKARKKYNGVKKVK